MQPQHVKNSPLLPGSSSCIWGPLPGQSSQDRTPHTPNFPANSPAPCFAFHLFFSSLSLNAGSKLWKKKDRRELSCCLLTMVWISLYYVHRWSIKKMWYFISQCWDPAQQAFNYLCRWSQDWEDVETAPILSLDLSLRPFSSGISSLVIKKNNPILHVFFQVFSAARPLMLSSSSFHRTQIAKHMYKHFLEHGHELGHCSHLI